jgi:protein CpxP
MKKIVLMCCLFLGITAVSYAQGGGRRSPEERAKQLQTELKLSDEQTTKVTAIYKEQVAKMDSLRTAGADRQAFRPLMQASNEKVKAILTPEQATAFEKWQKERAGRMRQGGGGNGGGGDTPPPAPQK